MNPGALLVAAPERWDESCFAVPAVRALVASGLKVGVLCAGENRAFWETLEGLTVVDFSVKSKSRIAAAKIEGLWDASLTWEKGPAAEIFKLAGIPKRLGPDNRKLRKLLTHPMGFSAGPLEHRVRSYLVSVEELGIETAKPEYFAPAPLGIDPEPAAVMLCPGSDFGPSYEWPLDGWEDIANRFLESGMHVTVASIDGGRRMATRLVDKLGDRVEFFHAAPLAGSLAVLAVHALVVAADGSLPHLASHAGTTCVTLFGPNDPDWKRPLGKRHLVVRRHVECAPCLLAKCPLDQRCQKELDVDRVWAAIRSRLAAV
jgi:ADP-heptose:LPS heptosyltransferase